jgi:fimbrial chaperone protein
MFWVVGLAMLLPATVLAASFAVNPVRVDLAADRPYMVVYITNTADTPLTLQARAFRWTGDEARGGLVATDELILNPPMLTVMPNTTRFLRLGLRTPNRGTTELPYRLALQEVPKAPGPNDGAAIRTILRMTIPVFAAPKTAVAPKPEWTLQQSGSGKFKLVLTNKGNAHIQVRELGISPADKTGISKALTAPIYVLPGQSHEWEIEDPEFTGQSHVKVLANTDAGKSDETVQVTYPSVAANPN